MIAPQRCPPTTSGQVTCYTNTVRRDFSALCVQAAATYAYLQSYARSVVQGTLPFLICPDGMSCPTPYAMPVPAPAGYFLSAQFCRQNESRRGVHMRAKGR